MLITSARGLFIWGEGFGSGVIVNFVEVLVSENLKNRNALLDVYGSDRKVLQIACQDFTNFLKVHWNLVGSEGSECEVASRLENFYRGSPKEMEEFLNVWTGLWLKKWSERVKLLIGNENSKRWTKVSKTLSNAEPVWRRIPNSRELTEVVAATLVKNGEICGSSILAENMLKMELGEEKEDKEESGDSDQLQVLTLVNSALRKARDLSRCKGPLIFVKVDKAYYNADN